MRSYSIGLAIFLSASLSGACSSSSDVTAPGPVSPPPGESQPGDIARPPAPPVDPAPREPGPNPPPPPPPVSSSCDHTRAQWAVGQRGSTDLLERARVAAGAGSARFLRPDEVVTLEYLASRLNLELDRRNVVRSVVCW